MEEDEDDKYDIEQIFSTCVKHLWIYLNIQHKNSVIFLLNKPK